MACGGVDVDVGDFEDFVVSCTGQITDERNNKLLASKEIEALIITEIESIAGAKKRPHIDSVVNNMEKKHGLARSVTSLELKYLLSAGILENKLHGGKYSLRPAKNPGERNGEQGNSRKISEDEDKLTECREELQKMAESHEKSRTDSRSENLSQSMDEESSSQSQNMDEAISSQSQNMDEANSSVLIPSEKEKDLVEDESERQSLDGSWGNEWSVGYRLSMLERKLEDLSMRFNSGQPATIAIDEVKNRVVVLENQNMKLLDENTALKIENAELKGFIRGKIDIIENNVKNLYRENSKKSSGNDLLKENSGEKAKQEVSIWDVPTLESPKVKDTISTEIQEPYPEPYQDNGKSVRFRDKAQREMDSQGWSFTKKKSSGKEARFENFFGTTTNPATNSIEPIETRNRFSVLQNIEENITGVKDKNMVRGECNCAQTRETKSMNMNMHEIPLEFQAKSLEQQNTTALSETRNTLRARELQNIPENNIEERKRNVVPGEYTYAYATERKAIDTKGNGIPPESPGKNRQQENTAATKQSKENTRMKDGIRFRKQTISILGDSMVSKIRKQDLMKEVPKYRTIVKTFRGARVEHMYSYMEPTIEMGADGIIIMCGTNNLRDESPEVVAKKIVNLALHASNRVDQVAVSSIVRRTDSKELDQKRKEVNDLLMQLLNLYKIDYIDQDNISMSDLDRWGLHLNYNGNNILTGDIVCDPMCGTGAICLEGVNSFPNSFHIGGEMHSDGCQNAGKNFKWLEELHCPGKRVFSFPHTILQWDACNMPLRSGLIDAVVCDLPFGKRIGYKGRNFELYPAALKEFGRVCRAHGKAILLTQHKSAMNKALAACSKLWKKQSTFFVNMGGLNVAIYVLKKIPANSKKQEETSGS